MIKSILVVELRTELISLTYKYPQRNPRKTNTKISREGACGLPEPH